MRSKNDTILFLENPGVVAVVRAKSADQVPGLADALVRAGLLAIEITMTTPNALQAINAARQQFGDSALIGVGTVLDGKLAQEAIAAGAEFVVSPITRADIAKAANEAGVPVMLGAYTPSEAQTAFECGADYIKLFPADGLGPAYVKALRAPLPHLKIVPTGGVDLNTIGAWFASGVSAVGVGSSLLSSKIMQENRWPELETAARQYVQAAQAAKSKQP